MKLTHVNGIPQLSATSVSLRRIFWLYVSKDGSGASLADLLGLAVLLRFFKPLIVKYDTFVEFDPISALKKGNRARHWEFSQPVLTSSTLIL